MRFGVSSAQAAQNNEGGAVATVNRCGVPSLAGMTWTERSPSAVASWSSVCWSPELRIAVVVSYGGSMWSNDGVTWTTGGAVNAISVCWSPELRRFVAVGDTWTAVSSDGKTWSSTAAPSASWCGVCWSPELRLFCAVSYSAVTSNTVMTSPDGVAWTLQTGVFGYSLRAITWSPARRRFTAVGDGSFSIYSTDGVAWTAGNGTLPFTSQYWASVCWSPELQLFVAVANAGSPVAASSPDGITWTSRTAADTTAWNSVCWAPELRLFVAVASYTAPMRVMTSPDGINWTARVSSVNGWTAVCWAPELRMFIAAASSDQGNGLRIMTSTIDKLQVMGPAANGTVAATLTSLGPTGANTAIQGWLRVNINGTDRYIPYW